MKNKNKNKEFFEEKVIPELVFIAGMVFTLPMVRPRVRSANMVKHYVKAGETIELKEGDSVVPYVHLAAVPNIWIYIYYLSDDRIIYDRSVSRTGLGPKRAKQWVEELEKRGHEAFYTIGVTVTGALS